MNEGDIYRVLEHLGCRKIRTRGIEVWATCPNESAHDGGIDRNPSFSVMVEPDSASPLNCLTCGYGEGLVLELVARRAGVPGFSEPGGRPIEHPNQYMRPNNRHLRKKVDKEHLVIPERLIKPFMGGVPRYIVDRGFTIETCKAWELGHDKKYRRAMFTVRDRHGRIRGISGRTLCGHRAKYIHYNWDRPNDCLVPWIDHKREDDFERFERDLLLYGEHMVDWDRAKDTFLTICEGQTDVLWLWQLRRVGLGVFGSSLSDEQYETILKLMHDKGALVLAGDADNAGSKFISKMIEMFIGKVPLFTLPIPDKKDVASMGADELDHAYDNLILHVPS